MSEYVTVETEPTDHPDVMEVIVNQTLTQADEEVYPTREAGEHGSTLAQTLFSAVDGLRALTILEDSLLVTRHPSHPWEAIIDEIRDVLRDFFL